MPDVLLVGVGLAAGVGALLWCWALAERGMAIVLLTGYSLFIPWGDLITLPLPGELSSPSTLLGVGAMVVMIIGLVAMDAANPEPAPMIPPFVAFAGLALLTVMWSRTPSESLREVAILLVVMAVFVLAASHQIDQRGLRMFEIGTVVGAASISLFALAQAQLGGLVAGRSGVPRFETVGGDANATSASLLLPFAIGVARTIDSTQSRRARIWWASGATATLVGIYLTVSRGALLSALVVVIVMLAAEGRWKLLLRVGVGGMIAGFGVLAVSGDEIGGHLTNLSSTGRTQIWRLGLHACQSVCDTGSGFGTFPVIYREEFISNPSASGFQSQGFKAHNVLLQMAVETGLVGFGLFLTGLLLTLAVALALPRRFRDAPLGATVGLLITSNLITNSTFKYYWLVPAYVAMSACVARTAGRSREPVGDQRVVAFTR